MRYRYWLTLFLSVLFVCGVLFALFYSEVKKDAINNLNNHQLVIAQQTKKGIEGFFQSHVDLLNGSARDKDIINLDNEGKLSMMLLYNAFSDNVASVSRVDEKGYIIHTFPYDPKSIRRDISYQPHIREIMRTRKPVMSDVFTAVQGFRAVALHVPVFDGTMFRGTFGFLIRFEKIAKDYLESIQIGRDGYAWLISREGTELYCPVPGHTGKTVFENCKDFPTIIAMAREMVQGKKGITTYEYNMVRDTNTETVAKHAVYLPIDVVNTYWSIVVATPDSEVLEAVRKFRTKLLIIFGILLLVGIPSSYFGARAWGILSEEEKRKEAERALKESVESYRTLFYSSVDPLFIFTFEWTLIDVNPAALELFGFHGKEEILKQNPGIISPEYQSDGSLSSVKAREMIDIAIEKGSHFFEWTHRKLDGTEFPAHVLLSRMVFGGRTVFLASVRDISKLKEAEKERMEMEKRVLQSQRLEGLGSLAGGIAHEFNNILTVVQASLEIALMEIGEDSAGAVSYINGAIEASCKAADLTGQMLAYAGKSIIPMTTTIDINDIVQRSIALCKTSIPDNITLHFKRSAGLPTTVADPGQIQQAAINLINNSSEAIGEKNGSITVTTGIEDCDDRRLSSSRIDEKPVPGRFVFLEVADTGCGMDEAAQQRLFEPFYTTKFIGRGLGTPAILGIVRAHHGAIFVESAANKGTTVRILLPLKEEARPADIQTP